MIKQPPSDEVLFQVGINEERKPFSLDCEATGYPEPKYKWTKNGQELEFHKYNDRISQQSGRGSLVWTIPQLEDEGNYQCLATNDHSTAMSNSVSVRATDLQSFPDDAPKEVFVQEGDPLTLPCIPPSGYPKPTIFWIIHGDSGSMRSINNSRIAVDPEGALHFSNVTLSDGYQDAYYVCSAAITFHYQYKLGNKVKLVVTRKDGAGRLNHSLLTQYHSPRNIVAKRGLMQEIHCIFGGTPLPKILWQKNNEKLDSNRYTIINYGKTLQLEKVDFQDEGQYECTGINDMLEAQRWIVNVTVQSVPYWLKMPNDTNMADMESVRFECEATGKPSPIVQWYINGVKLSKVPSNPRRKMISATVMVIEGLTKQDTAVFQCNASNALGYAFHNFYLNVLSLAPEIDQPPEALYETVDGSSITLRCRVSGSPLPEVKWLRDNVGLTDGRYKVLPNGDLEIETAKFADNGHYTCTASNKLGSVSSDANLGLLAVRVQTQIGVRPVDYEVIAGLAATFRCSATKDVNLTLEIDWMANGQLIDFDGEPRMYKGHDSALTIYKTGELDLGVYKCVAKTRLDSATASAILTVQDVPNPPRMVDVECHQRTATIKWQPMGDNRAPIHRFSIQYNTSFTPDMWLTVADNIPAIEFERDVSLRPWTNFTFRVLARNKVGSSLPSRNSIRCQTAPDVPHGNPAWVEGQGTQPDNLVISWTKMPPSEHNGPGFFYRVYWKRQADDVEWKMETVANWSQTELVLHHQPTFQPYLIKVEAHNALGQANVAAKTVTGYSGEDVPLKKPEGLTLVEILDEHRAVLHWEPVPAASVRGHFKGYKVQTWLREEGPWNVRQEVVHPEASRAQVYLVPFAQNFVRVLAFNRRYDGPSSDPLLVNMPEGKPGPVDALDAVPMGSNMLRLSWKKPIEPNGHLTGYQIYYHRVNGTRLSEVIARGLKISDGNATVARIFGLTPSTKYRVIVRAATGAGEGTPYYMEVSTGSAISKIPEKPTFSWSALDIEDEMAGVMIQWKPNFNGHTGSHFYVQYKRKDETQYKRTKDILYDDSVVIRDLEPGTIYEMKVVAVDGEYHATSDIEEIATRPSTTNAPSGLNWITSVKHLWMHLLARAHF